MTKEEGKRKLEELLNEKLSKKEILIKRLKSEGKWVEGLDTNRKYFKEINEEYDKKITELAAMVDCGDS